MPGPRSSSDAYEATGSIGEFAMDEREAEPAPRPPDRQPSKRMITVMGRSLKRLATSDEAHGSGRDWWAQVRGRLPTPSSIRRLEASDLRSPWVARAVLALLVFWFCQVFIPLVMDKHRYYATFDFDTGIFDQATWLMSRGRGFITVRGLTVLGHHLNLGLILFAPFYWLGAGVEFLNVMVVLSYAATAVLLTRVCRYYSSNEWYGVLIAGVFLCHNAVQNQVAEGFHPEKMAAPFIVGAILAALHRRWRLFALMVVGTLIWKEDQALFVFMLGLGVAWKRSVRIGLFTAACGAAYFLLATKLILPHYSPAGPFYSDFMGELGAGPGDWLHTLLTDHGKYQAAFNRNQGTSYLKDLSVPFGGVPFLAPASWVLVLPALFVNLFSAQGYTGDVFRQYAVTPTLMTSIAAVRGLLSRRTVSVRLGLCGLMLIGSLATFHQGPSPWSDRFETGIWPLEETARTRLLDSLVAQVPEGASVAATYYIVPHLTHRPEVYTFPNPWIGANWGIADQNLRNGGRVDWLLVDVASIGTTTPAVQELFARLRTTQFETVREEDGLALLRRTTPGD